MITSVDVEALAAQMMEDDGLGEWDSASPKLREQYMETASGEMSTSDLDVLGTLDSSADIDEATRKANEAMFADIDDYLDL